MRPTPNELVGGVVRILRDTVSPQVGDANAAAQLRQVITVLAQLDAEDASLALARADKRLVVLLEECRAWTQADEARREAFGPIDIRRGDRIDFSFGEVAQRHRGHRQALERFVTGLAEWRRSDATGSSQLITDRVARHLAGQDPDERSER